MTFGLIGGVVDEFKMRCDVEVCDDLMESVVFDGGYGRTRDETVDCECYIEPSTEKVNKRSQECGVFAWGLLF